MVLPTVLSDDLYLESSALTYVVGESIFVDVFINATENDVYAIQFDVDYDLSILSFSSILEDSFLGSDGAETFYDYDSIYSGKINDIYNSRNTTFASPNKGIGGNGILVGIEFTAIGTGLTFINLSNILWVNSTIKNNSVGIQSSISIENISFTILASVVDGLSSSSGGGGGDSGSGAIIVQNDSTNDTGIVEFGVIQPEDEIQDNETILNEPLEEGASGGFLSLTGGIVDDVFGEGSIFKSWVFYFIIGLVLVFVVVFFVRRYNHKRHY